MVLGLSISSSWGNGHATTYRALLRAFAARGHSVTFLERDVPWYSAHRDFQPDFCRLIFYDDFETLRAMQGEIAAADVVMLGSYVPDGIRVGRWLQQIAGDRVVFYDIDTPVTLTKLAVDAAEYVSVELIPGFALYLSFAGGPSLQILERRYGARMARPLYCSVDTDLYHEGVGPFRWDLSYLGTYSPDRQETLDRLLLESARRMPEAKFCVAGSQYPQSIRWPKNVEHIDHIPPCLHASFYTSSRYTLNVTRTDMIAAGYSPSVRIFEAAACGTPLISDSWPGIEDFLLPGREILIARSAEDIRNLLQAPHDVRDAVRLAAHHRISSAHTARHRAEELEHLLSIAIGKSDPTRQHPAPTPVVNSMRSPCPAPGSRVLS
jgi:spore maturation protein CgeB